VSAGAFFQTNRFLTDELVDVVTSGRSGELALDLYAGVGLFSTGLACNFRHTVSVESSQTAANDLKYNLPGNGRAVHAAAEQYLGSTRVDSDRVGAGAPAASLKAGSSAQLRSNAEKAQIGSTPALPQLLQPPDLVVVDPPRGGLGDRVARTLASLHAPRVTYVSCDPATLARDLVPLQAAGYRIEEVHLFDLFPQTYHLETVVHLIR
jgi:23S rRNA (uracil1939-C5)-methyltransferase